MGTDKIFLLILLQIVIIIGLVIHINDKTNKRLSAVTVHPIDKKTIEFTRADGLKHFYEPKPNTQIINKPDWLNYESVNTINSDTLNERFDYSPEKPKDTFRIITLGDSMTFGLYLNTKDNWTELLEDLLNSNCKVYSKYEVINLGVGGYDISYEVERFKRRGQKYNPDLLVWFVIDRNFTTLVDQFYERFDYYDNPNNISAISQKAIDTESTFERGNGDKILQYQLSMFQNFTGNINNKLLIFSSNSLLSKSRSESINNLIKENKNIYFTDQISNLTDVNNIVRKNDAHPNKKGSVLLANDLFTYLTKNKLVSCN